MAYTQKKPKVALWSLFSSSQEAFRTVKHRKCPTIHSANEIWKSCIIAAVPVCKNSEFGEVWRVDRVGQVGYQIEIFHREMMSLLLT